MSMHAGSTVRSTGVNPGVDVPESRFGSWFTGTTIWFDYVLKPALSELFELLGPIPGDAPTVVEIGCGHGMALPLIHGELHPGRLIAIDTDPAMIETARRLTREAACPAELLVADARELPLPDASVDVVFCHQTLHHVVGQRAALREFLRVLKPRGSLVLSESCRSFTCSLRVQALFRHPVREQRRAAEFIAMVREAGLEIADDKIAHPDPWWGRADWGLLERFGLGRLRLREPRQVNLVATRPQ